MPPPATMTITQPPGDEVPQAGFGTGAVPPPAGVGTGAMPPQAGSSAGVLGGRQVAPVGGGLLWDGLCPQTTRTYDV